MNTIETLKFIFALAKTFKTTYKTVEFGYVLCVKDILCFKKDDIYYTHTYVLENNIKIIFICNKNEDIMYYEFEPIKEYFNIVNFTIESEKINKDLHDVIFKQ